MHYLLAAFGSSGDVHPMVGIGQALAARGQRVTVITAAYFESLVRAAGLEFVDPSPEFDFRAQLGDPDLWHARRGPRRVLRMAADAIRPLHRTIVDRYVPGETVVLATTLALGARVAQETHGVPTASVHLSPSIFRSRHAGVKIAGLWLDERAPWPIRAFQYWLADRLIMDRMLGPQITALLAGYGRPRVSGIMHRWLHSPQLVLAMFPDWLMAAQPDWPSQTILAGFPLYDERDVTPARQEVIDFLAAGEPPVAFTPGSANAHGREFFAAACESCVISGRRGLLLTRFPEQLPARLPAGVMHADFVPFGWLLPRTSAIVHHGGIGTMAQGFAAGVPQLIMPLSFDQFDNAHRLEKLNCGRSLPLARFRGPAVAEALKAVTSSPAVAGACRTAAERIRADRPLHTVCAALARLGTSPNDNNERAREDLP